MGGGDYPHVDIDIAVAAERAHFALLQDAQQFYLQRYRHITDFIKKQRAAFSRLKQPFTAADRAGKRAARMAEQLRFQQLFRQRAAVNGDKRVFGARAGVMDGLRQNLFAGTALAVNQHADIRLRHHMRLLQQPQHHGTSGDNRLAPLFVACGRGMRQRIIDSFIQRVFIHRFGEKTEHALLGRRHRIRDRTMRGQNDHRHARLELLDLGEKLHAVHFIHPQIANHQIDLLTRQNAQPFMAAFSGLNGKSFAGEPQAQQFQQARIVIHQQQARGFMLRHGLVSSCAGAVSFSAGAAPSFSASGLWLLS